MTVWFVLMQAPVKTKQEIYENSMLEDDKDARQKPDDPRWGPKHKGAQTLSKYYSKGRVRHAKKQTRLSTALGWH
jgi:outer membrane biogenesis lipoprotein LolB